MSLQSSGKLDQLYIPSELRDKQGSNKEQYVARAYGCPN
jgi:hypothetical protein